MSANKIAIGNVEIIALLDVALHLPWSMCFPSVERPQIDAWKDLYPDSYSEQALRTNAAAYAIRSSGKTLICDTGIGPGPIQMLGGIRGELLSNINAAGIAPDSVDVVFHTHLHLDHVGWNMADEKTPNFPNARYYAPAADYELFSQSLQSNPQMNQLIPLKELGKLELYSGEGKLTDEVTIYPTPGHTPGHSSLLISSGGEKAMVMGDVAHFPAQVEHVDWPAGFDVDAKTGSETRRKAIERLESEGMTAAFCHFPTPGFGKVVRLEGRRHWQTLMTLR